MIRPFHFAPRDVVPIFARYARSRPAALSGSTRRLAVRRTVAVSYSRLGWSSGAWSQARTTSAANTVGGYARHY